MPTLCIPSGTILYRLLLLIFTLLPSSTFSFSSIEFDPNLVLIGDAALHNDASFVQLTHPSNSSLRSGFIFQKISIKFLHSISFSTHFSFTLSLHNADALAFLIVPTDFPSRFSKKNFGLSNERRFFGVTFDTNSNHVGVNVASLISAKSSNDLALSSGKKLHSWVDYDSTSKRVEVRLSEFDSPRPYNPLLVYQVDLGDMWEGKEVLVGLASSTETSFQLTSVYSWKFRVRSVPKWLHSHPMDPSKIAKENNLDETANTKRFRLLGFLSGFIFATGCVLLATFVGLFMWVIFGNNTEVAKSSVHAGDFRYEKVKVVVEDGSTHVKN